MKKRRQIAIFDHDSGGHHLTWLRLLTEFFLEKGCSITFFFPDISNLKLELKRHKNRFDDDLHFVEIADYSRIGTGRFFQRNLEMIGVWSRAAQLIRQRFASVEPDLVFFADLNLYIRAAFLPILHPYLRSIFSFPWSGIYLNPLLSSSDRTFIRRLKQRWSESFLRGKTCCGVAVIDEDYFEKNKTSNPKLVFLPDYQEHKLADNVPGACLRVKRQSEGKPIVGLFGYFYKKKDLAKIMRVASSPRLKECHFFIAGELPQKCYSAEEWEELQIAIKNLPTNFTFMPDRIPDEESLNAYVNLCEVILVTYKDFTQSSGFLVKAAHFRKIVLVYKGHLLERLVSTYKLGLAINEDGDEPYLNALIQLTNPSVRDEIHRNSRAEDFTKTKSLEAYQAALSKLLDNIFARQ